MIYYSNGYDLRKKTTVRRQSTQNRSKEVGNIRDLIAPKTIDEKIRKALRKKINIATEVMGEELRDWI